MFREPLVKERGRGNACGIFIPDVGQGLKEFGFTICPTAVEEEQLFLPCFAGQCIATEDLNKIDNILISCKYLIEKL